MLNMLFVMQEAYKQVYNWQYVHCVDFWSIVLARACDAQSEIEKGGHESELKALIYPLTQVTLGAIKCVTLIVSPYHRLISRADSFRTPDRFHSICASSDPSYTSRGTPEPTSRSRHICFPSYYPH